MKTAEQNKSGPV